MARPDCDDGWLKLAHELFAALTLSDFTRAEWIILRSVLDQCYGPAKRPVATIIPARLCHEHGVLREYVWKGLRSLLKAGVLAREPGQADGFRFIKDYDRWHRADGQTARLGEMDREVCRKARRPRKDTPSERNQRVPVEANASTAMRNHPVPVATNASTCVSNHPIPEPTGSGTNGFRSAEPTGSGQRNQRVPVGAPVPLKPPVEEHARKNLEELEEEEKTPPPPIQASPPQTGPDRTEPTAPVTPPPVEPRKPNDPLATPEDRAAQQEIASRFGEDHGVQAYQMARTWGVGLSWVLPAMVACSTAKGGRIEWNYVRGIVNRYRKAGKPDDPKHAGETKRERREREEAEREERRTKGQPFSEEHKAWFFAQAERRNQERAKERAERAEAERKRIEEAVAKGCSPALLALYERKKADADAYKAAHPIATMTTLQPAFPMAGRTA